MFELVVYFEYRTSQITMWTNCCSMIFVAGDLVSLMPTLLGFNLGSNLFKVLANGQMARNGVICLQKNSRVEEIVLKIEIDCWNICKD